MAKDIFDIELAESSYFELYRSKGYDDLLISLKLAQDNIVRKIEKIKDDSWTKRKLKETLADIDSEIDIAYNNLFGDMQEEAILAATITSNAILATVSQEIPTSTVNELINSNRQIQMGSNKVINGRTIKGGFRQYGFKELFKLTEDNHAKNLKIIIASGVAQGLTTKQIIRDFEVKNSELSKGQVVSNIFTTIADSRNQGNYSAFKQLEESGAVEYYEHVSVLDSHTSLEICVPRDGRRYYQRIDEISTSNKPPLHGNCRSKLVPRTNDKIGDTRASQFGEIPTTTYRKWFSDQSEDFQLSVLGKNKFKLFKNGSFKIDALADIKGRKMGINTIKENLNRYAKSS